MKKKLFLPILAGLAIFIIQPLAICAQEGKAGKVTVTVTENDKVVTDTTFELREGQDPETVKEIISQILGEDDDTGHKGMIWISPDGDKHVWHAKEFEFDFDSISKEEGDVIVIKDKDGKTHKVIVTKQEDGDKDIFVMKSKNISVIDEDEEDFHTIIIEESGDNDPKRKEKRVKVIVESGDDVKIISEDDLEWVEEDEEDENIYVIKKGDHTKVIKKVRVEVREDDDEEEKTAPVKEKEK